MSNSRQAGARGLGLATAAHRIHPGRKSVLPRVFVGLAALAAVVAVLPIVGAILQPGAGPATPRTAFAAAPAGEYVVVARTGEAADTIFVAPATDPAAAIEIATIPHLRGYSATGAVSPEGRRLALVVADSGTVARPAASLYVLDLETAVLSRLAGGVDHLQTATWAPDGRSALFTRTAESTGPTATVAFLRVSTGGGAEQELYHFDNALGAYAAGFDLAGRLVTVVIDSRGSTAYRDGVQAVRLSSQITRDWEPSPDGQSLAFIEADTTSGLRYVAKVVSLEGAATGEASAQSAGDAGQQLGVSWKPGAAGPTFGNEPAAATSPGDAFAQGAASGFDVPLAYSPGGERLAVQHWTGPDFNHAGQVSLELAGGDGSRTPLAGFTRFFGWAAR